MSKPLILKLFDIGAIYITSTNTNPSEKLGGTWELIDKEFKKEKGENTGFNFNTTNTKDGNFYYTKSGHSINLEISYKNKVATGDAILEIGTIDFEALGITRLANRIYNCGYSDTGNSIIMFVIAPTNGVLQVVDIVGEASNSANNSYNFFTCETIPFNYMLDSACDKFYWKRIS